MRTKAAVLYGENKPYSFETVELDPPKRGEVLVKVGAAGICRSDLHFQKGDAAIAMPAVLGHEGSGTVEAVGEGVSMVKPGDRVILSFVPNCGRCHFCETGRPPSATRMRARGKLFDGTSRLHTLAGSRSHPHGQGGVLRRVRRRARSRLHPGSLHDRLPPDGAHRMQRHYRRRRRGLQRRRRGRRQRRGHRLRRRRVNVIQGARLAGATTIVAVDVKESALEFARSSAPPTPLMRAG